MFPFLAATLAAGAISRLHFGKKHRGHEVQQIDRQNDQVERQYQYDLQMHDYRIKSQRAEEMRATDRYNEGVDYYNRTERTRHKYQKEQADIQNEFLAWQANEIDEKNRSHVKILELQNSFALRAKQSEQALSRLSTLKSLARIGKTGLDVKEGYDNIYATGSKSGFRLSKGNSQDLAVGNLVRSGMLSTAMTVLDAIETKRASSMKIDQLNERIQTTALTRDSYFDSAGNMKMQKFSKVNVMDPVYREHAAYPEQREAPPAPIRGMTYSAPPSNNAALGLNFASSLVHFGGQVAGVR